jgi:hypothetical protein
MIKIKLFKKISSQIFKLIIIDSLLDFFLFETWEGREVFMFGVWKFL